MIERIIWIVAKSKQKQRSETFFDFLLVREAAFGWFIFVTCEADWILFIYANSKGGRIRWELFLR